MPRDFSRLFQPKSIAVIGGGLVCKYVQENCGKLGFDGSVWHVHPTKGEFRTVNELPRPPDAVFVGVNRYATLDIVAELCAMGAGGVVAYASGFREAASELADGEDMQHKLLEAAGEMALLGPNCYGFLNYMDGAGIWPDQQGGSRVEKGVAIITQSSNIAINLTMQKRGLPIAYLVTAGNQAQSGLADIGASLLADPRVTALGLHIEGFGSLRAMEALANTAKRLGKPIVAIKAGESEAAQAATVSHTASLAGSAVGASAVLERLGIGQVSSLSVLLETLKLLHVTGPLTSNRIASMSCSGGEASLMADIAMGYDLVFPPLSAQQSQGLSDALGPKVALSNPLDYHTYIWTDTESMAATYCAMMTGDLAIGAVVSDFPRNDRCTDIDWEPVVGAVIAASRSSQKPMAVIASLPEGMSEKTAIRLLDAGVVPLNGMHEALAAIDVASRLGRQRKISDPILLPRISSQPKMLSEANAKTDLANFGLDVPRSLGSLKPEQLKQASEQIGFPLVLKGEGLAHKTEFGAVALDLNSIADVENLAKTIPCETFLIEEMVIGGRVELLVGVVLDPAHGYVLTLAAGGTLTEILKDQVSLLIPIVRKDVDAALNQLRIAPLLEGYRGASPVNRDAIFNAVDAVQSFVLAHHGEIDEIEVNPLICTKERAIAVDVLLSMGQADA